MKPRINRRLDRDEVSADVDVLQSVFINETANEGQSGEFDSSYPYAVISEQAQCRYPVILISPVQVPVF
jgi:hypothetical protein